MLIKNLKIFNDFCVILFRFFFIKKPLPDSGNFQHSQVQEIDCFYFLKYSLVLDFVSEIQIRRQ